uniref:Uncharacterized protein n=1 Tax=Capra hircus TaxID=9925 RepID=A0A8C2QSM2_CAPHI
VPPSPRASLALPLAPLLRVSSNRSPGPASYPSLFPASGLEEAAVKASEQHGGPRRIPVRPELFVVLPGWLRGLGLQGVADGRERRPRRFLAQKGAGIWDRLLIDSKPNSRKNSTLQTVRIERSPLLDQVQTFLPQMAQANEKLRKEMAAALPGHFNIENTDETLGQVIQMDVALFEMNQSHSKEEDSSEENSQDSSEEGSESEDEDDSTSSEGMISTETNNILHLPEFCHTSQQNI